MQTCKVDRFGMFNDYTTGNQQAHDVKQCRIDVAATPWRRIDVDMTLFKVLCLLDIYNI